MGLHLRTCLIADRIAGYENPSSPIQAPPGIHSPGNAAGYLIKKHTVYQHI